MPVGISCVSPGFSSSGASMQARRSRPAEPAVAYCGSGNSRPMRGIEDAHLEPAARAGSVRAVSWHGPDSSTSARRLRALLLALIALGDHFDQLPRQRQLAA